MLSMLSKLAFKTHFFHILGPPIVIDKELQSEKDNIILLVSLYSYDHLLCKWYNNHILLPNTSKIMQNMLSCQVNYTVYGRNASIDANICSLTVSGFKNYDYDKVHFCAQNSYGEICGSMQNNRSKFLKNAFMLRCKKASLCYKFCMYINI